MLRPRPSYLTPGSRLVLAALLLLASASAAPCEDVGLRIRFGMTDREPSRWDGSIEVDPGQIVEVKGWRFGKRDGLTGPTSWAAATAPLNRQRRSNRKDYQRAIDGPIVDNGVVVHLTDVSEDSRVRIETPRGEISFALRDLPYGTMRSELDGAVQIDRTATSTALERTLEDDDFPALATGSDGRAYLAWVSFARPDSQHVRIIGFSKEPDDFSFLASAPGGDQVWLRTLTDGEAGPPIAITEPGRDVYKCAVAVDGAGRVLVFWAERREGHFDIWTRTLDEGELGAPIRLSSDAGNDISPVATTDADGRVWLAWQGARGGVFRVLLRHQLADATWSAERVVSTSERSSWAPTIAATLPGAEGKPRVAVAWDTYDKGDYDVWLRELTLSGEPLEARPVANSADYEARPSIAYDPAGRLWIGWESSGPTWGKDYGRLSQERGNTPLYQSRTIGLLVLAPDGTWLQPFGQLQKVMPRFRPIRTMLATEKGEQVSEAARAAQPHLTKSYHNLSRVAVDAKGRPWLLFRSRSLDFRPTAGSVWLNYAAYYDGRSWTGPILLPRSDNLLYTQPAVATPPSGGLLVAYASDYRQNRLAKVAPFEGLSVDNALTDPWINDLYLARLTAPTEIHPPELRSALLVPAGGVAPSPDTLAERDSIARARAARTSVRGEELRLLRGEFHRHTELSSDGGVDGPLEDMWRYAIDVAALDWLGNGDHDNGHNREYPWWLIQKTTDAFALPGSFTTMFSYERSVPFPEGHRNVVFTERGVRPLPRLPLSDPADTAPAPDTDMLFRYLRKFKGLSAPHTTATLMGTDWRNPPAPDVEPLVEIYQGARNSYEMEGAPRAPNAKSPDGYKPEGFVSRGLAKGHRLGFVASSDHGSTHISYAMLWARDGSRQGIFDAMMSRRVYAATDNILADVRMVSGENEAFMGDVLRADDAPRLEIRLRGTKPFARVVVVRDGKEVHAFEPKSEQVELDWTDPEPPSGETRHYYVRGEQEDGELVWTSPIWVEPAKAEP